MLCYVKVASWAMCCSPESWSASSTPSCCWPSPPWWPAPSRGSESALASLLCTALCSQKQTEFTEFSGDFLRSTRCMFLSSLLTFVRMAAKSAARPNFVSPRWIIQIMMTMITRWNRILTLTYNNDNDHPLCPQVPAADHLLYRGGAACGHSGLVPRPLTWYLYILLLTISTWYLLKIFFMYWVA